MMGTSKIATIMNSVLNLVRRETAGNVTFNEQLIVTFPSNDGQPQKE
jgi:hypothetical protein